MRVAKSVFNSFVRKARDVANRITSSIRKIDAIKYVKRAVNAFFRVTESCKFEKVFKNTVGRIMRKFRFSRANVNAAYKLLTRNFWKGQAWLFKWVFTAGPFRSFITPSGGNDFTKASGYCRDFADTVNLGGRVMTKFKAFPKVVAAGKIVMAKAIYMKHVVCRALGLAKHVRNMYWRIRSFLKKFGIHLPVASDAKRPKFYNDVIGKTRRCGASRRRRYTRRYRRYRRRYVRRYRRYYRRYRRYYRRRYWRRRYYRWRR